VENDLRLKEQLQPLYLSTLFVPLFIMLLLDCGYTQHYSLNSFIKSYTYALYFYITDILLCKAGSVCRGTLLANDFLLRINKFGHKAYQTACDRRMKTGCCLKHKPSLLTLFCHCELIYVTPAQWEIRTQKCGNP
jgi:hypothetical protein